MMYLSVSLRYQRQLNLICPDVVESFFREAEKAAVLNGGKVSHSFSGSVFSFDNSDLCCVFSVSLTLDALLALLGARKNRIQEYLVFVDFCGNSLSAEQIADRRAVCENMILPDGCVLLNAEAAELLRPYAACLSAGDSGLYFYRGQKIKTEPESGAADAPLPESVFLYPPPGSGVSGRNALVSAFLNVIPELSELFPAETFLLKKEAAVFRGLKKAVASFASVRFAGTHPGYLLKGCEEYIRLFFSAFSRAKKERKQPKLTEIEIPAGVFDAQEIERFRNLLRNGCVLRIPGSSAPPSAGLENPAQNADADAGAVAASDAVAGDDVRRQDAPFPSGEIPSDIVDAAYLIFRASAFLYRGELDELFVFLGKHRGFRLAVQAWMAAFGFPEKTGFGDSIAKLVAADIPPAARRERLDRYLFSFLSKKYADGSLLAGADFLRNLSALGQKIPDSFLIATVFRSGNPKELASRLQSDFAAPQIGASAMRMEDAEKMLRRGSMDEAQNVAKNALHDFQRAGITAGEFEVFSFYARLSFSKRRVADSGFSADSAAYLDYAFEDAEKIRDSGARMRCLFDFAAVHYLTGNFPAALKDTRKLREVAFSVYDKGWEAVSMFFEGRIHFSLGAYRDAEKFFHSTESFCSNFDIARASPLCRAWAARARIYQTKKSREYETLRALAADVPEAWLFCLEEMAKTMLVSSGKFPEDALWTELPVRIPNGGFSGTYDFPDVWTWGSSFSLAEDRFLCGISGGVLPALYAAFYAYCRAVQEGTEKEALAEIAGYAADSQAFSNPHAFVFYYLCYALENRISGLNSSDSLAFLSRSFKSLQSVANNISDSAVREQFLQEPYWNALLYSASKENKLI